jgi:hypothetical protein
VLARRSPSPGSSSHRGGAGDLTCSPTTSTPPRRAAISLAEGLASSVLPMAASRPARLRELSRLPATATRRDINDCSSMTPSRVPSSRRVGRRACARGVLRAHWLAFLGVVALWRGSACRLSSTSGGSMIPRRGRRRQPGPLFALHFQSRCGSPPDGATTNAVEVSGVHKSKGAGRFSPASIRRRPRRAPDHRRAQRGGQEHPPRDPRGPGPA